MFKEILKKLYEHKVKYLLVGGLAVNLWGIPRTTADVDIMLDLSKENLDLFLSAMKSLEMSPKQPIDMDKLHLEEYRKSLKEEKNMLVATFINPKNPIMVVDFFLENPIDFKKAFGRRKILKVEDFEIYLIDIEDLIKMKQKSKRLQDKADLEHLKRIKKWLEEENL